MKKLFALITVFALVFTEEHSNAQTISTYAGTGTVGYSGSGGPATSAMIYHPHGCTIDGAGNLYFSDYENNCVRKVTPSGTITTIAGNGTAGYSPDGTTATSASIYHPFDVAIDASGTIYFTEVVNHIVRKINAAGQLVTIAGVYGVSGSSGDGGPATAAHLTNPSGLVIDASGNVIVVDQFSHCVRKINTSGIISTIAGDGSVAFSGDGGPATAASLSYPNFINLDNSGNLLLTDNGNHRIRKITPAGIISTIIGNGSTSFSGDGGPATAASLQYPGSAFMDAAGNIWVADNLHNRIRKVNTTGIISTVAGNGIAGYSGDGGPATTAKINGAVDVVVDAAGSFYISDFSNNRIRKVSMPVVTDNPPMFTDTSHMLMACENTEMITVPSLEASDIDTGQTETYSLLMAPLHGAVYGLPFSTASTGGVFSPAMISYTPASMYYGADSFSVLVSDGTLADTQLFHVTVLPNNPGTIAGADTLCIGDTATMSNYINGGFWTTGALSLSTISVGGFYTAVAAGTDTVFYNLPNLCNAGITSHIVTILTAEACAKLDVNDQFSMEKISVYPNPNQGVFTIKGLNVAGGSRTAIITDLSGRKVAEYPLGSAREVQVTTELNRGVYLVVIAEGDSRKVLKMVVTD
jgi:hypothetical protein